MNEEQIVRDWLTRHSGQLPALAYSKEVCNFIKATSTMFTNGDIEFYKVNGFWQRIIQKDE